MLLSPWPTASSSCRRYPVSRIALLLGLPPRLPLFAGQGIGIARPQLLVLSVPGSKLRFDLSLVIVIVGQRRVDLRQGEFGVVLLDLPRGHSRREGLDG